MIYHIVQTLAPPLIAAALMLLLGLPNPAGAGERVEGYIATIVPCMIQPPYECTAFTSSAPSTLLPDLDACRIRNREMTEGFKTSGYWPNGIPIRVTAYCYPVRPGAPLPLGLGLPEENRA